MTRRDAISWASARLISSPYSSLYIAMNSSRSESGIRRYFGNILVKRTAERRSRIDMQFCQGDRLLSANAREQLVPAWHITCLAKVQRPPSDVASNVVRCSGLYINSTMVPSSSTSETVGLACCCAVFPLRLGLPDVSSASLGRSSGLSGLWG